MFHHSRALLRLVFRLVLVGYFVFALAVLGLRYWLLPNIDQYRPYIAEQISLILDSGVSVAKVSAEWSGLNPSLALTDVVMTDPQGGEVFSVPSVRARLSWRSLFLLEPRFIQLQASGIDLTVRRDADRNLHVLGREFEADSANQDDASGSARAVQWLASQQSIALHDTVIRWVDDSRDAPPLVLRDVTLDIRNQGARHEFSLAANPPAGLGEQLDMRGSFDRAENSPAGSVVLETGHGQLYLHLNSMPPLAWAPWIDMPAPLKSGQVSAQAWLHVSQGKLNHATLDVSVDQGYWEIDTESHGVADYTELYLDGPAASFYRLLGHDIGAMALDETASSAAGLAYRLQSKGIRITTPEVFAAPLVVQHLGAQGMVGYGPAGLQVQADRLDIRNADIDASLHGSWEQDESHAGQINMQGKVARASVPAIGRYMPMGVGAEARKWMAYGLAAGEIHDASLLLKGELAHFPFDESADKGDFQIRGSFRDTVIDYLPPVGKELGWPAVTAMGGQLIMQRAGLTLQVDAAILLPDGKQPVHATQLTAQIPDLAADNVVLQIDGDTQGDASAYLGLMQHSPLGRWLEGVFDDTKATGVWQVPLSLSIPLDNADLTTVKGHVQFDGGQVQLTPHFPVFQKVQGKLGFTETQVSASDLTAQLLGGQATIGGELGGKGKELLMQGRASAKALANYVDQPGMQRLSGDAAYTLTLQELPDYTYTLALESDLRGMGMAFPAPLKKAAAAAMPFRASWKPVSGDKNARALSVELGNEAFVRFLHTSKNSQGPYFHTGVIGLGREPTMLSAGINVDLEYPDFDADAWQKVVDEFSVSTAKQQAARARPLLPELQQVRLQSRQARFLGLLLDELTYTVKRPDAQQWRADISSSQTAGTLQWRESGGKVVGPVQADFHRLALGPDSLTPPSAEPAPDEGLASALKIDESLKLPAITMKVKNLRLYGREVGELELVGVNRSAGQVWSLEKLKLSTPWAELNGTGTWRLRGADRGLVLDATAEFSDVGKYFEHVGMPNVMGDGQGSIKGTLEWRNMPWDFSKSDLNGEMVVSLDNGRFQSLGSHSARLLELLSFQSFSRLARMDLNPTSLVKDGYPYDSLRGTLVLNGGVASTHDYRVIGPVGTIVLDGKTSLIDETLDARAVVIPNLDVSGAAIAAGIAINPIVGIGTFLTQWLLKAPLAKAMTAQYHIGGSWDEPKITEGAPLP